MGKPEAKLPFIFLRRVQLQSKPWSIDGGLLVMGECL